MVNHPNIHKIPFGGDYNPEQWPKETWQQDLDMLKEAHIDILTLNVFSWALLQKDDDIYDFSLLDDIINLVSDNGFMICLATSTGAHPAWMARKHPDILRVNEDGIKRTYGGRHNSCPNSPTYQLYSKRLAEKLALRYKNYDNIVSWHINNEYGGFCYCENCQKAFRVWLKDKYHTMEALNQAWYSNFWSHTYYDWEDIVVPNKTNEIFGLDELHTCAPGICLDYQRFMSDSVLANYQAEYDAIKKHIPNAKITTNFMYDFKDYDYMKWGDYLDFASWDSYPSNTTPVSQTAMNHDLMRGLKNGQSFALMEQTPSSQNWQPYCSLKRPNVMRLWSYQAIAHGADAVLFFQMKRGIGSCEKYHGAVIDHAGTTNTRVFREVKQLGEELSALGDTLLNATTPSKVALLWDYNNWWAIENSAGPSNELKYLPEMLHYYEALLNNHISCDIIGLKEDLTKYQLVIAPILYMVPDNYDEKIRSFVKQGGHFLTTYFSGLVNEHDLVTIGGYPGKLRDILGIWVEEEDALCPGDYNHFCYRNHIYPAAILCDLLHLEGASAQSCYEEDFYKGMPVLTSYSFGKGKSYYVATSSNQEFYNQYILDICNNAGIQPLAKAPSAVEITLRENEHGQFLFLLNHSDSDKTFTLPCGGTDLLTAKTFEKDQLYPIKPKEVLILKL